ncbi:MarR family transcriptional regulator [Alicyclobacillus cycloheptanicus]|uniref:DNA-binding MarR family transcriptional regulator n=1 Tax=Alicyclobacillus cycloheptanicus TaxID=1457 RepID=A0ABT9XJX1_9BACL|nr:MarR family transcriptional regulator [Alicyclobacillus cycloheptanicus]MDQ0190339.1 DNA-binding MarR family transcriptional regulator [Alicyclobacillus cycloheptanicus]WDM00021.1 MarR family transcriptional regulator [Alicyclobacillus cycloheptanicus]
MAETGDEVYQQVEHYVSLLIRRADITKAIDSQILDRSAYILLGQLDTTGSQTISTLASRLLLDISTVSRQIAALESKGLVHRVPHPENTRSSLFTMTAEGQRLYNLMREKRVRRYREILADWPDEETAALARCLKRLNESIEVRAKRWLGDPQPQRGNGP